MQQQELRGAGAACGPRTPALAPFPVSASAPACGLANRLVGLPGSRQPDWDWDWDWGKTGGGKPSEPEAGYAGGGGLCGGCRWMR